MPATRPRGGLRGAGPDGGGGRGWEDAQGPSGCSVLSPSCPPGTGCEWPTFPEKRDQDPSRLDAWFHWQVAHIRLAVLFGFDLSLIPARMTGNTKYFARIKAQLEGPTASTTARYHGPQKTLNPKKISVTQLRVASRPQEGQPDLQTPQPLPRQGSGEGGTGWLSSAQPRPPAHDSDAEVGVGARGGGAGAGCGRGSVLPAPCPGYEGAPCRAQGSAPSGSPRPRPCCVTALCTASRLQVEMVTAPPTQSEYGD